MERQVDLRAKAGQRLVDGVVHHFVNQVMQAARGRRPDVHAGPLAYRLEALEDLDRISAVIVLGCGHDSSELGVCVYWPRRQMMRLIFLPCSPSFWSIAGLINCNSCIHGADFTRTNSTPSAVTASGVATD